MSDLISRFMNTRGKRVSEEQTVAWILEAQAGNIESRNKVVEHNMGLVMKIAYKYAWVLEDAIQEGVIGLMRSIETYDPEMGAFSTYAIPWIQQKVRRFIEDTKGPVRAPNYLQQMSKRFKRLKEENPSRDADFYLRLMSAESGQTIEYLLNAFKWVRFGNEPCIHIDKPYGEDEDQTFDIEDIIAPTFDDVTHRSINYKRLFEALTYKEKFILIKRCEGWILEHIAIELGITRERVRQIEDKALRKVRATLFVLDHGYLFTNKEVKDEPRYFKKREDEPEWYRDLRRRGLCK